MAGRLQDRVAIVTGAAQGIGEGIARRFVEEGATVVGIDRNEETLTAVAASLEGFVPRVTDLRDHEALKECVAETLSRHEAVDILVNNAAIAVYEQCIDMPVDRWRDVQAVNLEAPYVLSASVAPSMIGRGYGRIVNISSTQSIAVEAQVAAYAASKGGINALTRSLAVELAPHGIVVNAIAPGVIHTPMSIVNGQDETEAPLFQEWYVQRRKIPLARPGLPAEIAAVAVFLGSEECSYVTGHVLVADGGLTITF
jgi:NAD(P)-dependent dehydrogenase (short-subunit alcohol dehydrogenase family)